MAHETTPTGPAGETLDWVGSRDELVDLAMARRIREPGETIRSRPVDPRLSLGDQLVETLAGMVELAGSDHQFENLAQALPEAHAFAFIAGPSELTEVVGEILEPFLDRAQAEGVLRDGMGIRAIAEWVQVVLAPLRGRHPGGGVSGWPGRLAAQAALAGPRPVHDGLAG